ncbi:hypothetical protein [Arthrospira platensis]|uniref:hypothetical protein n=1 Tax=Limnospira platensis TaxID=118562 RepID=UPI000AC2FF41
MRYHPRSPNELGTLIIPNSLTNLGAIAFFFPKCDRLTKNPVSLSYRKCDRYLILRKRIPCQNSIIFLYLSTFL